jgi:hypothetical protein
MKSLLFYVLPTWRRGDRANFLAAVRDLELPDGAERLAENVWLVAADSEAFLSLSRACRRNAIDARFLPVVHETGWQNLEHP